MMRPAALCRIGVICAALSAAGLAWAQETITATVDASGMVTIARGDAPLAVVELNAHGSTWQHAPQSGATARSSNLPDRPGKRVEGSLPVPGVDGGAIRFVETVRMLTNGLQLEYDLGMSQTMRLNGLQLSILLPVKQYAGQELTVTRHGADPEVVGLPEEQAANFQLWRGDGARVEAGKDSADAVAIQLRAATDIIIQDLRQWEHDIFEIRFPAIMEDGGREVPAEDRFHLDLTLTFTEPVKLGG